MLVAARRDEAAARLESRWTDVKRLAASADTGMSRATAASISDVCQQVKRDYPIRRAASSMQRSTGARLGLVIMATSATLLLQLPSTVSASEVDALLLRGQLDAQAALR